MPDFPTPRIPALRGTYSASVSTSTDGLSGVVDLGGHHLTAIQMSTAWTDASLTFRGSVTSTDAMRDVYGSTGSELSYSTSANRILTFPHDELAGVRFLQIRSGSAATPVAQAAERTIVLGMMPEQIK